MIRRNWKTIILYLALFILYAINIIVFIKKINLEYYLFFKDVNRFSFWNYCFHEGFATVVMFLLPILICFISISDFSNKMQSSCLKNSLLRQEYTNYLKKEMLIGYLKSAIPFILISVMIFFVGMIFFKGEITNLEYADLFSEFNYSTISPYYHVVLSVVMLAIFIGFLFNLSLIIYRFIRKYSITIILSFICLNVLNYLVSILLSVLSYLFSGKLAEMFYNFNLYSGYLGRYYIQFDFFIILILFILSLIVVILVYKDKEKVVMDFE